MNVSSIQQNLVELYYNYPVIVIGLGILILIWVYLRPKQALKGGLFLCFVVAVFYLVSLMTEGTGSSLSAKEKMMHKTEKALAE